MVIAQPDSFTTSPDQPLVIAALANDGGFGLEIVAYSGTNHGKLVLNTDGTFTYTPDPGFLGGDGFTYTVRDASGATADGSVAILVAVPAGTPAAVDDYARTAAGVPVRVPVLANDTDPDGEALAIVDFGMGAQGSVEYGPDRTLIYTPGAEFAGTDTFDYRVADATGHTAGATVTVEIERANRAPEVRDEAVETFVGQPITIPVTANDRDPDGDVLRLLAFSVPSHGSVAMTAAGGLTYTPVAGFAGADEFTYDVGDTLGARATARVAITVNRVNVAPSDRPETVSTSAEVPVVMDLLANATDSDGDPVRLAAVTMPTRGMLKVASDQKVTYTPQRGFAGPDSFAYTVSDGKGGTIGSAVAITVTSVPAAFANGFSYRRRVIVPAAQVPLGATLTNFPVWIDLQGTWLKPAASGGKIQHPSAWDVRFELPDGTVLAHELDRYEPQAGRLSAWVRVPRLAFDTGVELSLFYGKAGVAANGANAHVVWGDYLAVWHLPRFTDSSSNGRNLTLTGTILNASDGLGAGSAGFDGTAAFRIDNASWLDGLGALTVQVRANADAVGHNHGQLNAGVFGSDANSSLVLRYDAQGYDSEGTRNVVFAKLRTSAGNSSTASRAGAQTTRWQWLALRWASGDASPSLLLDGEEAGQSYAVTLTGAATTRVTGPLYVGTGPLDAATGGWQGLIDEVRLRATKLSEPWVLTEYRNQSEPLAFYGVGDEDGGNDVEPSLVAVPLKVRAVAGSWIDLDVVGAAIKPAGAAAPTIVAVEHPSFGSISITGGKIRYAPTGGFLGSDALTYTLALNNKRSSSTVSIDIVAPTTDGIPDPLRVVDVATMSELVAAIGNVRPGDHITLADGTYAGSSLRIGVRGTAAQPIVIRAKNRLRAKLTARLELTGSHIIALGLDLDGRGARVGGEHNRVSRCRIVGELANACDFVSGHHGRLDHCDVTVAAPGKYGDQRYGCNWPSNGATGAHLHATVDHNWFHDFPAKFDVNDYHSSFARPIRMGEDQNAGPVSFFTLIEYNLLERIMPGYPEGTLELKSTDCTVRFNTLVDSPLARMQQRQGFRNHWEGNWVEGSGGFNVLGWDHKILGNRVIGADLRIMTGDDASRISLYPAATNVRCSGNHGTMVVGADDRPVAVSKVLVENHTGRLTIGKATEVTNLHDQPATITFAAARRLTRAEVGPDAP